MDKILRSFTKKYINTFNYTELTQLSNLLKLDDENLYKFNVGKINIIKIDKIKSQTYLKIFII